MTDIYQERYLKHQAKKKEQLLFGKGEKDFIPGECGRSPLINVMYRRVSQRLFTNDPIHDSEFVKILQAATLAPSSCNRRGIRLRIVSHKVDKELLSGILVGGVGWIHRADKIVLFLADMSAYKSPAEKDFMPYCDVGFVAQNMWLMAEDCNVGAAYINPNIREELQYVFDEYFNEDNHRFCGALALGMYDTKCYVSQKPQASDLTI